jgi:hypothetical protein
MFMNNIYRIRQANAWVKRSAGPDEIIRIVPDMENQSDVLRYKLYIAYGNLRDDLTDEKNPDYLGRILFDAAGYWIYDGDTLTITEQEQLAKFIINYSETL